FLTTSDRSARVRALGGAVVPVAVYGALRFHALGLGRAPQRALGGGARVATAFEALGRYVGMTLDAFRPRSSIGMLGEVDGGSVVLGGVVSVVGLVVVLRRVRAHRQRPIDPGVALGSVLAAGAIAPVLHVVPFSINGAVTADRLLYLPLAGVAIALAVVARSL